MPATALTFTRTLDLPPAEVFAMFTSPTALQAWACHVAQVDPRPGGRVYLWWNQGYWAAGGVTALVPDQRLAFTWRDADDPATTVVQVDCAPTDGGTRLKVTHSGLDAESAAAERIRRGWEAALDNLQSILATGVDLREARRPMFGLAGGDSLTAAQAAALGVPVTTGLWISGLLDGLGAAAAGLQRDDVLVRLDGQPISDVRSLGPILAAHRAGDVIEAVFYRGPVEQRTPVTLSSRPRADLPTSLPALVESIRAAYAALDPDVVAAFGPLSAAEAAWRSAPDAWNARQVLAHLISVERDMHTWITKLIEGGDLTEPFHANDWTRISALAATYPTVADLLTELQRSEAATVAMIATLPPAVARQKYLLAQLAAWALSSPDHVRDHLAEMPQLLAATRAGTQP